MNHGETEPNQNRRSLTIIVAVVGASLIFAALVWQTKKYTRPDTAVDEARKVERAKARAELTAAEAEALSTPAWIDQNKGLVRLPIADAMKLAERQWQNPAQARAELISRVEKATELPPPPPEQPSPFE